MKDADNTAFMLDMKYEVLARFSPHFKETATAVISALSTGQKTFSSLMQWEIAGMVYMEHLAGKMDLLKLVMERDGIEEGMRELLVELEHGIHSFAESLPHSTSPESNRVKEMEIKAEAEMARRIQWVLSQIDNWNKMQSASKEKTDEK